MNLEKPKYRDKVFFSSSNKPNIYIEIIVQKNVIKHTIKNLKFESAIITFETKGITIEIKTTIIIL